MHIHPATLADWSQIKQIYRQGIRTKMATFETEAQIPDGATWFAGKLDGMVFKAVGENGRFLGWAALSPISKRHVYRGVVENSVYIAADVQRQGVGLALMQHLIAASEAAGIWTIQTSIFVENKASIHLHQQVGFRPLGVRQKIGQLDGIWRDTLFMERRSAVVG